MLVGIRFIDECAVVVISHILTILIFVAYFILLFTIYSFSARLCLSTDGARRPESRVCTRRTF